MEGSLAIDVALLVSDSELTLLRKRNLDLLKSYPDGFSFDETHFPHVTLIQRFVKTSDLAQIIECVQEIFLRFAPLPIEVTGARLGGTTINYAIAENSRLRDVHETLMKNLADFEETEGAADSFFNGDEPVRDRDVEIVGSFHSSQSLTRYYPHITLGVGREAIYEKPFTLTLSRVAICQLGRFCTCRKIFWEQALS